MSLCLFDWEADPLVPHGRHCIFRKHWVHPVLFSSHLTQCLGHWGLQGMRTMVFSHWKGTGMFAAKPSSWLQCLQIRAESKASRPSILGVWSWMAPEGVCVCVEGGELQYHPQSSATHNCLLFQWSPEFLWYSFPLRWTHMQNLMCEVKFSGPGGGQEGHLSTQHHPMPHGWTHLRIYSTPSLCGCRRKGLEWDSSFSGSQGQLVEELKLAPPRNLHSAARALWVPYSGYVQCGWHTLEPSPTMPLFWALWVCKSEYRAPSSDKKQTPIQMSLSKKG